LTTEAQELLRTVDKGGAMPAFISRNLRRIAEENGVQVKAWMTADNVIDTLRTIAR
jgi:putative aminopeptidase FrvX